MSAIHIRVVPPPPGPRPVLRPWRGGQAPVGAPLACTARFLGTSLGGLQEEKATKDCNHFHEILCLYNLLGDLFQGYIRAVANRLQRSSYSKYQVGSRMRRYTVSGVSLDNG